MSQLWLKGGRVLDPDRNFDQVADVLIEGEKVVAIEKGAAPKKANKAEGIRIIDCKGKWIVPGLVDIHTHLRDPGFEYKETIASGSESAARGGFTTIVCMANTNPVNDNASITEYILNKADKEGSCGVLPVGTVTKDMKGENLSEFGDLKEAGVVALSDDGMPVLNPQILRNALSYAKNYDLPIISHCEDPFLTNHGCMNEGFVSTQLGLAGIPNASEDVMVSRDIELAELTQGHLHLAHLSTRRSVSLLKEAKERGVPVTGEVTPHHFTLTDEAVREYDSNAKMNPPLRTEEDRQAILDGLKQGVFDAIASDHAPHSVDEKEVEFQKAPFGIIGFETTVGIALKLVHEEGFDPLTVIRLLTIGPAQAIKLNQDNVGKLRNGVRADITVIDPDLVYTFDRHQTASLSCNSPFHGWKLKGKAIKTILAGELVYDEEAQ